MILHRISRLNASTSMDYGWWRKAYKTNTKSERGSGEPTKHPPMVELVSQDEILT